jgi:NAD(P)-dependent dehydrogenase (short-subunit alcohol dehydrogenase family)
VIALTRAAVLEGDRFGITPNSVLPGFIDTPLTTTLDPVVVSARMTVEVAGGRGL